jgi:DGQHR domain-containing protein
VKTFTYRAVRAKQSPSHEVVTFAAKASDIMAFAEIDRAGRDNGSLKGFQRPQIASHVKEIREYLTYKDAVLPNAIVVAFIDDVSLAKVDGGVVELKINVNGSKPGYVVDGQQRLTALSGLPEKDFEVFVSALICQNYDELKRQFVLINNTRPLPKALIYELLPSVTELPERLASRASAASLTERLNYEAGSSLRGMIYQHTNPHGRIRDTAIQKVVMNSASDGALREISGMGNSLERAFQLVSDFYGAVQDTFPDEWQGHTPRTSRLVHGAGIRALGYVMDLLWERDGANARTAFAKGLSCLQGHCAWTKGAWRFGPDEMVPWNELQNIDRQIIKLAQHLVATVKRSRTTARHQGTDVRRKSNGRK